MRKPTLKGIKKKADKVFSEYIRRLKSDKNGWGTCVSCGKKAHWKELQCGHYFSRGRLATRFHDDNANLQCSGCNIFKHGNYTAYAAFMFKEYGSTFMEDLENLSRKPTKITIPEYQDMIVGWQTMMEKMK